MKWPTIIFTQIVKDITGGQRKIQKKVYLPEGHIPVVDQGQELISGYTDDETAVFNKDLPVVLFGDHTRIIKFVDFPFALGADGVKVLHPLKHLHSKFLYFFLNSVEIPSRGYSRHFKFLKEISIPVPPPSEQQRIVEILDQADALREKRAEADARAERILPALFYKMFGDPVTNPKDWDVTNLSHGGATVRYGLGQPPEPDPDGIPLIRATNISRGMISEEDMMFVSHASVPETRNAFLTSDEVIVVRSGAYTGDLAHVTERWAGSVAGYDLIVTPGEGFCGEFIEAYLLTPYIQKNYFGNLKARAGQAHLNASQLSATPILRPPKDLQLHFAQQVRKIRQLRNRISYCQQRLDVLFSVLLSRAFSGELTAKWRESHMQELLIEIEEQTRVFQNIG